VTSVLPESKTGVTSIPPENKTGVTSIPSAQDVSTGISVASGSGGNLHNYSPTTDLFRENEVVKVLVEPEHTKEEDALTEVRLTFDTMILCA